jgi:three-Cys-motif partner protein
VAVEANMKSHFHDGPFSESTKVKLSLFGRYFEKWLPTFLHRIPRPPSINVVDFFSGPGEDSVGTPGSPQLLLQKLRIFKNQMATWGGQMNVVFNDADTGKAERLEALLARKFSDVRSFVEIRVLNREFADLYVELQAQLAGSGVANLLFVDQSGVSQLPVPTFLSITELEMTDLIFFVSSSTFRRFHDLPDIKKYLQIPEDMIHATQYFRIHKLVKRYYESQLPAGKQYFMGDFSLKKDANIYGLVFGSNHLRGLDKFVATCWELDGKTGEANYSIDREPMEDSNLLLFPLPPPLKIAIFQEALTNLIKSGQITTNRGVLEYSLKNGMLARQAKEVLRKLKADGLIETAVSVSYEKAGRGSEETIRLKKVGEGHEQNKD